MALDACAAGSDFRHMATTDLKPMPELKRRRKERRLSLEKLAALVGLSTSQVQRFETGEREPRRADLENLAHVLECRIEDLLGESDAPIIVPQPIGRLVPVPLIGYTAAGVFREVTEFDDAEPEYVFEPEDEDFPKARRFALIVEGDSMNAADPPMPDGSRVICVDFEQTGQPFVDGMIVVIERLREGGHLREWSVKEIELHGDEVWFCPRSTDRKYKPIKISENSSDSAWKKLQVIGLVRDVSRRVRANASKKF